MIKQNPFSLYDFLGYFIPGALLIYLLLFIQYLENFKGQFVFLNFLNIGYDTNLGELLFFVIISYGFGHLINFMSSITIEKYANWKYDYPSKYLLGIEKNEYWQKSRKIGNLWRILLPILILPVTIFDLILGDILRFKDFYTRKLDDFLIEVIKEKGQNLVILLFKNKAKNSDVSNIGKYDFFRIFAHYTFENTINHQFKLVNYVVLYGFLRTLTLITVIAFWYSLYSFIILKSNLINFYTVICIGIISYIFFMAFMKFYRRYTLEGFMLIAIDKELV